MFSGGMYYLRKEDAGALTIRRYMFSSGQDTFIAPLAKPTVLGLSLAPDGKQLIYSQLDEQGADLMVVPDFASMIARQ